MAATGIGRSVYLIQIKIYYMQNIYIYINNIGYVCTVYRIQLYLKLLLLSQQGCKTLHCIVNYPRCTVQFLYFKDKMYCYWADQQTVCFIEPRGIVCLFTIPVFCKVLSKFKPFHVLRMNFPNTHINIAI